MAASICVRYRLGRLDVAAWVLHFALRHWFYWAMAAGAAAFLAWREFSLHRADAGAPRAAVLGGLLLFATMWAAMVVVTILLAATRRSRQIGREIDLEADDDGLRLNHADGSTDLRWTAIQSVSRGPRHLFLRLGPNQAILVPRRAVLDATAWVALAGFCRTRAAAARG